MSACSFYLECNGKILTKNVSQFPQANIYCRPRILGGKGGFGSMLRAIGAQIEKTTNREACRDLSGRRLRDINEEKRVTAWLDKQNEEERQAKDKKKRKIENLLRMPKHEFKDTEYEEARSKLTEKVYDAIEEGFQRSLEVPKTSKASTSATCSSKVHSNPLKRKVNDNENPPAKKATTIKKPLNLWIDDNLSETSGDSEDEESCDESDNENKGNKDSDYKTESSKDSISKTEGSKDSVSEIESSENFVTKTESSEDSTSQQSTTECEMIPEDKEKNLEQRPGIKA